jgi:hypothetical protein
MTREKIFERPEGNQVKVSVWLYAKGEQAYWGYVISFRNHPNEPWMSQNEQYQRFPTHDDGSPSDGEGYPNNHYVTPEEILEVKYELWESIRPD